MPRSSARASRRVDDAPRGAASEEVPLVEEEPLPRPQPHEQDERDAENLLAVVSGKIIPEFFHRDETGIPRKWIARMRHAMRTLLPQYNTNRMVAEYVKKYYLR